MTLFEDYDAMVQQYSGEYGSDSVVILYEVGSFYELYGCDEGGRGCNVKAICQVLGIQATRKNKNIPEASPSNPDLAGFPSVALAKYLPILLSSGYTVGIAKQTLDSGSLQRKVVKLYSKSTYAAQETTESDAAELLCLHLQAAATKPRTLLLCCGGAVIDLRTGACRVFESVHEDVIGDVCSSIASHAISEVLIVGDAVDDLPDLLARLEVSGVHRRMIHDRTSSTSSRTDNIFLDPDYQNAVLAKVYPDTRNTLLSSAEYVGLERHAMALASLVAVLDFAYKHDEGLINGLPLPNTSALFHLDSSSATNCRMSEGTLRNLDVLARDRSSGQVIRSSSETLLDVLNTCVTAVGRRAFRERLLHPIVDASELERRYQATETAMPYVDVIRRGLRGICDIERIWRRISMQSATLQDAVSLRTACQLVDVVLREVGPSVCDSICDTGGPEALAGSIAMIVDELGIVTDEATIKDGAFPELDGARQSVQAYTNAKVQWIGDLRASLQGTRARPDWVRPGVTDEPCPHALCTPTRFKIVREAMRDAIIVIETTKSTVKFTSRVVRDMATSYAEALADLDRATVACTRALFLRVRERLHSRVPMLAGAIAALDVHSAIARDAVSNSYARPTLQPSQASGSFLVLNGLRHPLAERLTRQQEAYVHNDVHLDDSACGILLFGVNAAGKSTLSKAVALAVLMAQAGMHVACSSMRYRPFGQLFTRTASRDDLCRGKSTFMVELAELRSILRAADDRTLVVGDELCSGTESASALSIVGSACISLENRGCRFIFATHLHELPSVSMIKTNHRINVFHLGVAYNPHEDRLVYERKLLPGPGDALYGLEVARALHMDAAFMSTAHTIRREVLGVQHDIVSTRRSKHNPRVFVDVCTACGLKPAQETHHVAPQKDADSAGMIARPFARFHKNAAHNLRPLCIECHDAVHQRPV